jgi:hypothetical protein
MNQKSQYLQKKKALPKIQRKKAKINNARENNLFEY